MILLCGVLVIILFALLAKLWGAMIPGDREVHNGMLTTGFVIGGGMITFSLLKFIWIHFP